MVSAMREIDWTRLENSIPAALTVFMTGLSGSITDGIAMGFMSYVLVMWVSGRRSEISLTVRVLGWVFLGYFLLNYWIIPRLRSCQSGRWPSSE
jgi:AGZA family xanthine/uracil permease-like MFS transporter